MTKTRDLAEFYAAMGQEYPGVSGLAAILEELVRLSKRHAKLQERACNEEMPEDYAVDAKCEARIRKLCEQLPGCVPVFSGDPRGVTVKLKVPSGRTNDWGGTGICVPQ
jgi:hypothetical protein